jgi:DNA-directed RNA polymerase subunit omega
MQQVSLLPVQQHSGADYRFRGDKAEYNTMNADLIEAASKVIPNQSILINMVSRRVRQLSLGHRPMVEFVPGLRAADIALTEIINEKLTFESTFGQKEPEPNVVKFPGTIAGKKRAA